MQRTLFSLCLLSLPASAQHLIREIQGSPGDAFGYAIAGLGDLDGDGVPELAVSDPFDTTGGPGAGRVWVRAGADGSTLFSFSGMAGQQFGSALAGGGDFDGDGIPDLAVGAPGDSAAGTNAGAAYVFSGANGALLGSFPGDGPNDFFGRSVSIDGDWNGDGRADLAVGAPSRDATTADVGYARIYAGSSGVQLFGVTATVVGTDLGAAVGFVGDQDGDGRDELAVGSPVEDGGGGTYHGLLRVYAAASGLERFRFEGGSAGSRFGFAVDGAGDLDGDGRPDLVVGSPRALRGDSTPGELRAYSGADGSLLNSIFIGGPSTGFGTTVAGVGDVDADGTPDYMAGSPQPGGFAGPGFVALISGATHALLYTIHGSFVNDQLSRVTGAGDVNGDGVPDFAIAGIGVDAGFARIYSHVCLPGDSSAGYCPSNPNSTGFAAEMAFDGSVSVNANNMVLRAGPLPNQPGLFFYGANQVSLPFGSGVRCVGGQLFRLAITTGSGGELSHALDVDAPPSLAGQITAGSTWNFQAWFRDPAAGGAAFNTSDGLEVRFCQ